MQSLDQLIQDLNASTDAFTGILEATPFHQFNQSPKAGAWSAGDVGEHILILEKMVNQVVGGPSVKVDRNPAERIDLVKGRFLDFDQQFTAPDPIQPSKEEKIKVDLIQSLRRNRMEMVELLGTLPLEEECQAFEHRLFGKMTRIEWTYYNIYHTARHIRQVQRLLQEHS